MGVLRWIGGAIFGFIRAKVIMILALALAGAVAVGGWQYKRFTDARAELAVHKSIIEQLEAEHARQERRLKHLAETAEQREQRKEQWVAEALKWKNRMKQLVEDNEDVAQWASDTYPAELD